MKFVEPHSRGGGHFVVAANIAYLRADEDGQTKSTWKSGNCVGGEGLRLAMAHRERGHPANVFTWWLSAVVNLSARNRDERFAFLTLLYFATHGCARRITPCLIAGHRSDYFEPVIRK